MEKIKLKEKIARCPFCNKEAFLFCRWFSSYNSLKEEKEYTIGCETEDCWCEAIESDFWFDTAEDAIKAWHKRENS